MTKVYQLLSLLLITCTQFFSTSSSAQMAMDDCTMMPPEHCQALALVPEMNANVVALHSGNWFSASTWSTGAVPAAGSKVLIDSGLTVTYNGTSETEIKWIRVNGTLTFSTNINTKLKVNTIIVDMSGALTIGTATSPVLSTVKAQVIFSDEGPIDTAWDPYFYSKGIVCHGAMTVYGSEKKTYCYIINDNTAGSNVLKVGETPDTWKAGDRLVLAGTRSIKAGNNADNSLHQDELLDITSVSGKNIYFTNANSGGNTLLYDHKAPAGYGLRYYVANLTRNVIFETENWQSLPAGEHAHIMVMYNANQNIYYAAFNGLGRTDKQHFATDPVVNTATNTLISGGENPRGRYAVHIHKAGTNNPSVAAHIKGCAVYNTPGWGIVNHSSNAVIEDNVVYEFSGSGYVTEAGNELGAFNRNIAIKGVGNDLLPPGSDELYLIPRLTRFDLGFEGDGYWIHSHNVELDGNIATSCAGQGFNIFSDDNDLNPVKRLMTPTANVLTPSIANGSDSIPSAIIPLRKNNNSVAYNCAGGMAIWTHMYNADNVGDFSNSEYTPYTHDIFGMVENFKFWNLLQTGINISYSSQIYFKNGLLLGDLDNRFQDESWYFVNDDTGLGIFSSAVSGQFIYENITAKGWVKALAVMRTDDLVATDTKEYNYRTSRITGGLFENNTYNLFPEKGNNIMLESQHYQFARYFEISGSPVFNSITSNVLPTAEYTYSSAGGTSVKFDGTLSSDPDAGVTTDGNGIAAYAWSFGDGTTGYGADIVHHYAAAGTYSVILTVYDSQGQTKTMTKNVYVTVTQVPNIVVDPGFELSPLTQSSVLFSTRENTGFWMYKDEWARQDGKAVISKAISEEKPLVQIIKNDKALQGTIEFSFQAKNLGLNASSNNLKVEIIGINDEFEDPNIAIENNLKDVYNNDLSFDKNILLSEDFGLSNYDWQTFKRTLNFGSGYQFIVVKFYSYGLKPAKNDAQGLDNICLPCICQTPQSGMESSLTSTTATLIWDNVGAEQYLVQVKPDGGGAWTSYTVYNTFLNLTSLIPNKTYQWKVQAMCSGAYTTAMQIRKFTTPLAGSTCTNPVSQTAGMITSSAATLSWNTVPGAISYQISYKKSSSSSWTTIGTSATSYRLSSLTAGTNYQFRIRTQCTEGWKAFTITSSFATLALREDEEATIDNNLNIDAIYPNPATDEVNIQISSANENAVINLTDLTGTTVMQKFVPLNEGVNNIMLDVHSIAAGIYIIHIIAGIDMVSSGKLVIQ